MTEAEKKGTRPARPRTGAGSPRLGAREWDEEHGDGNYDGASDGVSGVDSTHDAGDRVIRSASASASGRARATLPQCRAPPDKAIAEYLEPCTNHDSAPLSIPASPNKRTFPPMIASFTFN